MRLFACACCRQIWHLLADQRLRTAVEAAEQYAAGLNSLVRPGVIVVFSEIAAWLDT